MKKLKKSFLHVCCIFAMVLVVGCSNPTGGNSSSDNFNDSSNTNNNNNNNSGDNNGDNNQGQSKNITDLLAGVRPENIIDSNDPFNFNPVAPDHFYFADSSKGVKGQIQLEKCLDADMKIDYYWYYGTEGNKWKNIRSTNSKYNSLDLTVLDGTTYYICKVCKGNNIVYSNVCTVICGTDVTEKIGSIVYSTASGIETHPDYDSNYGEPVGIVCEVNKDGSPKKILNLKQSSTNIELCDAQADGYLEFWETSFEDGSKNWNAICNKFKDYEESGKYPAFEYCNNLNKGNKSWYLPAICELITIYYNSKKINDSIQKLPEGIADQLLTDNVYWSSTQYCIQSQMAFTFRFNRNKDICDYSKEYKFKVRAISLYE